MSGPLPPLGAAAMGRPRVDSTASVYESSAISVETRTCTIAGGEAAGPAKKGKKGRGVVLASSRFSHPMGLALHASRGLLYVADGTNQCIRMVDLRTGKVGILAGVPGRRGFVDGPGGPTVMPAVGKGKGGGGKGGGGNGGGGKKGGKKGGKPALFDEPCGLALDDRSAQDGPVRLIVADTGNDRIRAIDLTGDTAVVTTLAGGKNTRLCKHKDAHGELARLSHPTGVAVSAAGHVFVADCDNHCIRRIDAVTSRCVTIAGVPGQSGLRNTVAANALFNEPFDVAITRDGRTLFVSDYGNHCIRRVDNPGEAGRLELALKGTAGLVALVHTHAGTGVPGCADTNPPTFDCPSGLTLNQDETVLLVAQEGCQRLGVSGALRHVATVLPRQGPQASGLPQHAHVVTIAGCVALFRAPDERGLQLVRRDGVGDHCTFIAPRFALVVSENDAQQLALGDGGEEGGVPQPVQVGPAGEALAPLSILVSDAHSLRLVTGYKPDGAALVQVSACACVRLVGPWVQQHTASRCMLACSWAHDVFVSVRDCVSVCVAVCVSVCSLGVFIGCV